MIEQKVMNYLNTRLDAEVYMEIPAQRPESFVVFEKTGYSEENGVATAVFAFQAYGTSLLEAATLNERVKGAMSLMADIVPEISRSKLETDYNYTETGTKNYRYQAVYDITYCI